MIDNDIGINGTSMREPHLFSKGGVRAPRGPLL